MALVACVVLAACAHEKGQGAEEPAPAVAAEEASAPGEATSAGGEAAAGTEETPPPGEASASAPPEGDGPPADEGALPRTQPPSGPEVTLGEQQATGSLGKNIIRRYIRRELARIRYCYEKELVKDAALAGTVTAEFTIAVDGKVSHAAASGMNNVAVESCIADVVRGIQFPAPQGGGVVKVVYPFRLTQGE